MAFVCFVDFTELLVVAAGSDIMVVMVHPSQRNYYLKMALEHCFVLISNKLISAFPEVNN